jgi:uncharacterized membrane protein
MSFVTRFCLCFLACLLLCASVLSQSKGPLSAIEAGFQFTTLQVPNSNSTIPFGVNNHGDIVGTSMVAGVQSGFLYSGGQFQTIACPNNSNTLAQGINDDGVIVGWCSNPFPGPEQGFVHQNGSYSYVTYPGSTLTVLNGINRQGDLIGVYLLGQQSGFAYTQAHSQA